MDRRILLVAAFAVLAPALAGAVPAKLGYQGRLLKADGSPEGGVVTIRFAVFAQPSAGQELWSETQSVALTEGYYATALGEVTPLSDAVVSDDERYLEISVNGVAMTPRQRLSAVPFALRAGSAENVSGGVVDASAIKVGGQTVIDGDGKLVGAAAYTAGDGISLSAGAISLTSCPDGKILKVESGAWVCAEDSGTTYDAVAGGGLELTGTSFGLRGCGPNEVLKFVNGAWTCGEDLAGEGTVVAVTATAPLLSTGGPSTNISLAPCASNQVLKWNGTAWACASDANTTYGVAAKSGLVLSGTSFSLAACAANQILRHNGTEWVCVADSTGTVTSVTATANRGIAMGGTAAAPTVGLMTCSANQILRYSGSAWACVNDSVGTVTSVAATANRGIEIAGTAAAPTVGLIACTSGQVLRHNGTAWACSTAPTGSVDYIQNQASANQSASFRISGTGAIANNLGVGVVTATARLHVVGPAAATGAGTLSASSASTATAGSGTTFTSQVAVGDVIRTTGTCTGTGQSRLVTAITSDTALTIDTAWTTDVLACTFSIQKPIVRLATSGNSDRIFINAAGSVGIATTTPQHPLDVNGVARFRSQINAEGGIRFGALNGAASGSRIVRLQHGRIASSGLNTGTVTFPTGYFTSAPYVFATPNENGTTGSGVCLAVRVSDVSTTGFTWRSYQAYSTYAPCDYIYWMAIQP